MKADDPAPAPAEAQLRTLPGDAAIGAFGLEAVREFVGSGQHSSKCNGCDDGPCDCGYVEPSEVIDALLEQIALGGSATPLAPPPATQEK